MKMLFKKLFRDIGKTIGQFISILLVLAVGCFFFAGLQESSIAVNKNVANYYESQNFAGTTATFGIANDKLLSTLNAEGKKAEGRLTINSSILDKEGERNDVILSTITSINKPYITEGNLPKINECIVDMTYAEAAKVAIGDVLTIPLPQINGVSLTMNDDGDISTANLEYTKGDQVREMIFRVSGFYHSPEYISKINPQDLSARPESFAVVAVNYDEIKMFSDKINFKLGDILLPLDMTKIDTNFYNQVLTEDELPLDLTFGKYSLSKIIEEVKAENPNLVNYQDVFAKVLSKSATGIFVESLSFTQSNHPSERAFRATYDQIKNLIVIFPFIFFIVAAIITFISLSKTVENQRTQIGVMQAMGINKSNIYLMYLCYAGFAALIGSILGGVLGIVALPSIYSSVFNIQFVMPPVALSISPVFIFIGTGVALAVAVLAAFVSCHRTLREIPAAALRPRPPKKTKKIMLERWDGLWKRLGFGAKMILRNIYLHKMRIFLSSVGVIGCIMLLVAGIGLKDRVNFIMDHYESGNNFDIEVAANSPFDVSTADKLAAAKAEIKSFDKSNNISDVNFMVRMPLTISFNGKSIDSSINALPAHMTSHNLFLDKKSKTKLDMKENTFALPKILAEKLEIKVGDELNFTIKTRDNEIFSQSIVLSDIIYQYVSPSAYTSFDVFNEIGLPLNSTSLYLNVLDKDSIGTTQKNLIESEKIKSTYTFKEITESIQKMMVILNTIVMIIVVGAAVLAITVIYNITSINIFERTREIATLMVLGYTKRETNRLIMVENMVITSIGCILGLPLGFGLFSYIISIVNTMSIALTFDLSFIVVLVSFALAFLFSVLATLFLNKRMQKINMVEALKSVE